MNVQSGGQIVGSGQITVGNGSLSVDGDVQGLVTVQTGGLVTGTGSVGAITVQSGGTLSVGHSVGTLTLDGGGLPGNQPAAATRRRREPRLRVQQRHRYLRRPGRRLGLHRTRRRHAYRQRRRLQHQGQPPHRLVDLGQHPRHGRQLQRRASGTVGNVQTYYWKFIGLDNLANLVTTGSSSLNGRFNIIDDAAGAGVFYDAGFPNGNPFARPESHLGQGTFYVLSGDFGQGTGLYIHYSAVPEPGSLILTGLGTLAAGWYGKRRRKKQAAEQPNVTTITS